MSELQKEFHRPIRPAVGHVLFGMGKNGGPRCDPKSFISENTQFQASELTTQHPGTQTDPRRTCRAFPDCSLTVEAALVLPLFLIAVVLLIWPVKVMDGERRMLSALDEQAQTLAVSGYLQSFDGGLLTENALPLEQAAVSLAAANIPDRQLFSGVLPIVMLTRSDAPADTGQGEEPGCFPETETGQMISLHVSYRVNWPFTLFERIAPLSRGCTVSRRAWTGRPGGTGRSYGSQPADGQQEADPWVYLGRNHAVSGVFHETASCSYLDNVLRAVAAAEVPELRNAEGEKYHPCPSCRPEASGTVYIFENGSAYHAAPSCRAIGTYVTQIRRSEALERGLRPCSRCSQKKE